jgi:hypothetical protein
MLVALIPGPGDLAIIAATCAVFIFVGIRAFIALSARGSGPAHYPKCGTKLPTGEDHDV